MADKANDEAAKEFVKEASDEPARESVHLLDRAVENLHSDPTYAGQDFDTAIIQSAIEVEIRPHIEHLYERAREAVNEYFDKNAK